MLAGGLSRSFEMPYYRLFYHFVWTTKRRLLLINDINRGPIYAAISAKATGLNGIVHALNGMEDHMHLVVTVPPTTALGAFIGRIKGSSSYVASHLPDGDGAFSWQAEYGVLSVSESHLPMIIDYVNRQQEHHAAHTLNRTLEHC
jgi:putative transposase